MQILLHRKHKTLHKKKENLPFPNNCQNLDTIKGWHSMTNWLMVLVLVLPLLNSTDTIDPNLTVRYIFLSLFVFSFVLFFFVIKKTSFSHFSSPLINKVFSLGLLFSLWSLLSMFFAINPATAYFEIARYLLNLILLFLIMILMRHEGTHVLRICRVLVVASLIQSVVGLLQYNNKMPFTDIPGDPIAYGFMGARNLFASAQVLLTPFVFYTLYKAGKKWKCASVIALIGIILSVALSRTRSAWLSISAIVIVSLILIIFFSPLNRKAAIAATVAGTLVTAAMLAIILSNKEGAFSHFVKERAFVVQATPGNDTSIINNSILGRFTLWKLSLRLIKDHPVIGVGRGNWRMVIPAYGSKNIAWADGLTLPSRPHNTYLEVASETGIPGALLYFSQWILLAVIGLKTIKKTKSEDTKVLAILMLAGLAAFATDSMFSFPTERIEHSLYFILMAGIILGLYANSNEGKPIKKLSKLFIITAIILTGFNLFLGYKKYNFEVHAKRAKIYRDKNWSLNVLNEVGDAKSKLVTIDPKGEPVEMQSSAAYVQLSNYEQALEEIKIARAYHPNSARILTTMGVIYANLKQYDSAINCYIDALKLTPKYEVALKNLAGVYYASGNYAACIETLNKFDIKNNEYLINLFNDAEQNINGE